MKLALDKVLEMFYLFPVARNGPSDGARHGSADDVFGSVHPMVRMRPVSAVRIAARAGGDVRVARTGARGAIPFLSLSILFYPSHPRFEA